jgi:SAM-dependent methyltransferase
MPIDVSFVVLSNIPKDLGIDVEVRVGVPSKDPWSLPFAHRTLFRERIDDFDHFIYSEDDTLLRWTTLKSFFETSEILPENEVAGFFRTEKSADGRLYFSTCHAFFRWVPSSVRQRGGYLWAKYSNEHSACFIASQEQLRRAIHSGGFPVEPHEGRYDMLVTAATDFYVSCGLERLICIDRIHDFSLPHLPNKYIGILGTPAEELAWQISALREIYAGNLPTCELLQPETRLPGSVGSKRYREEPDPIFYEMLNGTGRNILVWGAGDGLFEADLQAQGYNVSAYPLNAVMGECCRQRGLTVLPIDGKGLASDARQFDAVVLRDVLHVVENPQSVLDELRKVLRPGGRILVRVPNFHDCRMRKSRLLDPRFSGAWDIERIGAVPFTVKSLSRLIESAGFGSIVSKALVPARFKKADLITLGLLSHAFSPSLYLSGKKI